MSGPRLYIWNNTEHIGDKKCEMEVLHSGRGRIPFPSGKTKGPRRLRDRKQQLDFIIAAEGTTDCDGRGSHQILNAPDMTVEIAQDPSQREIEVRTSASMGEHLQYIRDSLLEIVNNVTRETRLLECAIRTLRRNQVVNAAHSDGILAAEQMGLPPCHLVEGYGDMATVWWCQTISTLFSPRNTSCGVEPAAGRLTIAKNGWTLIPHQECEWKHNLANFNGALYLWNTTAGNWTRIEPNLDVSHGPMMRKFELDIENWDQWAEVPHPGMSESNRQQLEQLLDMIAEKNPDMANPEEPSPLGPYPMDHPQHSSMEESRLLNRCHPNGTHPDRLCMVLLWQRSGHALHLRVPGIHDQLPQMLQKKQKRSGQPGDSKSNVPRRDSLRRHYDEKWEHPLRALSETVNE